MKTIFAFIIVGLIMVCCGNHENDEVEENSEPLDKLEHQEIVDFFASTGVVDFDDLSSKSIKLNKPILLYFTGYSDVNSRKIEYNVLSQRVILDRLVDEYIFVPLYVDDRTQLPEEEWTKSSRGKYILKTVGRKNMDFQAINFDVIAQPYFVILNDKMEVLKSTDYTNSLSIQEFDSFLTKGLDKFK